MLGNEEKLSADWAGQRDPRRHHSARMTKRSRQRHHGGARDRAAPDRRHRRPRAGLRAGAERLRPSLHVLHHPVRPRELALGADGRGGRRRCAGWSSNGYREVVLTGVDITSYGADLPGAPRLGKLCRQILKHVPELAAAAPLLDRLGRGRPRPARRHRQRAAADAASASLAAAWRRPHPQAHEAAALARRRDRVLATRCAGCAPTSCSAPISSRAFRPRPRRCSRARSTWWTNAGSRTCMSSPSRARPGTPAARMPQVPRAVARSARGVLRQDGEAALRRHLDGEIGARRRVLTEANGIGRTEQFTRGASRSARRPRPDARPDHREPQRQATDRRLDLGRPMPDARPSRHQRRTARGDLRPAVGRRGLEGNRPHQQRLPRLHRGGAVLCAGDERPRGRRLFAARRRSGFRARRRRQDAADPRSARQQPHRLIAQHRARSARLAAVSRARRQ